MTLLIVLVAMILMVTFNNMLTSPMCGYCGKRLVHAKDCKQKKDRP